jgi:SM-20-related protein
MIDTLINELGQLEQTDFDATFATRAVEDLVLKGYTVQPSSLPLALLVGLQEQVYSLSSDDFERAGIGRARDYHRNQFVRSDDVCWMTGESAVGAAWLDWCEQLRLELNRQLFLGLFSFESHYARYRAGAYYKRHYDAFRGQTNRVLSLVSYLNSDWALDDGGELILYESDADKEGLRVTPLAGTTVLFLSERFPHEVLPAKRDRYSIAGWFRVNSSNADIIDPPR